jgi:putative PIN family toxin of toxin-antitoxin system
MKRFVLDTNVLVSGLRSSRGQSFRLISALPLTGWQLVLSVPVYLEYQDVLLRPGLLPNNYSRAQVQNFCRFLASLAEPHDIHFLWPSFLADAKDNMLLELAVASGATCIVTHNIRHFEGAKMFGIEVLAPSEFSRIIGLLP